MPKASDAEIVALGEAGPLLRFAAEHVKDLDPDLSLAIAEARAAADNDQWTPQVSQRFWSAFSKLCDHIRPVTMDCLAAAHRNIAACNWTRGKCERIKISLAERSSTRYLIALFVLIVLILPLQLYVWTCTNLSKKIDDLISTSRPAHARLSEDFRKLTSATRPGPKGEEHVYTAEESALGEKIKAESASLNADVDRMLYEAHTLERISTFFIAIPTDLASRKQLMIFGTTFILT